MQTTADRLTMAQDNNDSIKAYFRIRKMYGSLSYHQGQRLQRLLETRKLYRSDEPMKVWVIKDAYGEFNMVCLEDDFNDYMSEYHSEDTPVKWHNETMTGREFGNLEFYDI